MIDRFKNQTNETIWKFLREIGESKEVFSSYYHREIFDEVFDIFFYATPKEIVLLCLDIVENGTVERADKEVIWTEPYLCYFIKVLPDGNISKNYYDWRLSPAMILYSSAWDMRRFISCSVQFNKFPTTHLMLLTNSHIVNYPEVVIEWQQNQVKKNEYGFTVLQDLQGLSRGIISETQLKGHPFIPVNEDLSIEGSEYWSAFCTSKTTL